MAPRKDEDTSGEKQPLLGRSPSPAHQPRLSATAAACCIVDLFGVFPVLALPRALLACGWWGVVLALVVVLLQAYTARLLARCWLLASAGRPSWSAGRHRSPYAALADIAFGPRGRRVVAALLNVAVFGAYVPDLLFAAENMHLVGRRLWELEDDGLSFCIWLIVLGIILCPLLWFGSPKDQKLVTSVSVGLVLVVAGLTWLCVAHAPWPPRRPPPAPAPTLPPATLQAVALAYGNLLFQFDAHPAVLTVQVDMAEPKRMGHAITGAYILSLGLALCTTALAGFLRPGTAGRADVLQALPGSPLLYAAVIVATVQIMLSTLMGGSALFQDLEQRLKIPAEFSWRRCALRGGLLACAVLLALASPRLPLAMGLLGAAVTGPLSLVLPPLLHTRLLARLHTLGPLNGNGAHEGDAALDEAKLLVTPRRSSVETAMEQAEATAAAEDKAKRQLVSDASYRRLADDTRIPSEGSSGDWMWSRAWNHCKRACCDRVDRWLELRDARSPPSRLRFMLSVLLAAAGAASSGIALYYAVRDAAEGARIGRGPASCLGLPF